MSLARRIGFAVLPLGVVAACLSHSGSPTKADDTNASGGLGVGSSGGAAGSGQGPTLECLAGFIPPKCATAGCHDAETRAFAMDLSTGQTIYAAWVNRNGLDNCGGNLVPRVVPGEPENSFVYRKISSRLDCIGAGSQPMPPPPAAPLTAREIAMVREWIERGAPEHCPPFEPLAIGGTMNGSGAAGGAAGGAAAGAPGTENAGAGGLPTTPEEDPFTCTASRPCDTHLICQAPSCSEPVWGCMTHRPQVDASDGYIPHHPCPAEAMEYCGCDGVTFVASITCPDRPYQHPGACGDGYNCDPDDSLCGVAEPACADGEAPSIVHDCFADCVSKTACRCEFNWECPADWQCDRTQWRCTPPAMPTP